MLSPVLWFALLGIIIYILYKWYRGGYVKDFHKKTVFITGADTGFGRKLALDLDHKGLTVYAGCYTKDGAENMRKEASNRMRIMPLDVTSRESIIKAKDIVKEDLPPGEGLWALVNNAGIFKGFISDLSTLEDYQQVMDVNFYGAIRVTEEFLPLIKRVQGRVINVISIAGRCSLVAGPYTCSKFAYEAYSDGLRRSMLTFGVKVCIIEPGAFRTNIISVENIQGDFESQHNKLSDEMKALYNEDFLLASKEAYLQAMNNPVVPSYKLEVVTNSIAHAIGSKHPKDRYVIGLDANFLYRPLSMLPDVFADSVFLILFRKPLSILKKNYQQLRTKTKEN